MITLPAVVLLEEIPLTRLIMKIILFILIACFSFANQCYFLPPVGWEIAHLKKPSPHVQVGFIGKGSGEFLPKINLALEEGVDVSLKEYVKIVKSLQLSDKTSKWRDLGVFPMKCGKGRLAEITKWTPHGEVRILQAFYVADEKAYILTAAVSKADHLKMQKEILASFATFDLTDNLFSLIPNLQKREEFISFFDLLGQTQEKESEWQKLQDYVKGRDEMGSYWQFLVLQEGHAKIFSSK